VQTLFAQAFGRNNQNMDEQIFMFSFYGAIYLVILVITVFYLLTLHRALGHCRPRNRKMEPGMVWLTLIPCFPLIWNFFIVNRIAESLRKEFRSRGMRMDGDGGQGIGTAMSVLQLLVCVPIVNYCSWMPLFIIWILYWVKIAGYNQRLSRSRPGDDEDDDGDRWDDEYDDVPPEGGGTGRRDDVYDDRWEERRDRHGEDDRPDRDRR
jgi:hypothetical protein